jgi:hypothetical protein
MEKLPLLLKHYGISDEDDHLGLALALAGDFVPGFQIKNAPLKLKHGDWGAVIRANAGRRITWSPKRLGKLLDAVGDAKQKHGLSTDREALKIITQNGEWRRPIKGSEEQWLKTLQNCLPKARRLLEVTAV